jgi:hypothetical protein
VSEQAVIIRFDYGSNDLSRLFELEGQLEAALAERPVGELDGNEVAVDGSDGLLYFYGPDADALFDAIRAVLTSTDAISNAVATLRYGPPEDGVPRRLVKIEASG